MASTSNVIDAAIRFARTNPELVAYARAAAPRAGRSVDQLLREAIERVRAELEEPAPREQAG